MDKIGIIQTTTRPGDFPNNLRAIVQGYRECLDHGADLVLAPAHALCGLRPQALAGRQSFLRQQEDAALALAAEIASTDVPLVLGYYIDPTDGCDTADYPDEEDWAANDDSLYDATNPEPGLQAIGSVCLTPCMIHRGNVRPLPNDTVIHMAHSRCYFTMIREALPEEDEVDLVVHMTSTPWTHKSVAIDDEFYSWESNENGAAIVSLHDVGAADERVFGGGSAVYRGGRIIARLPFFEAATRIINLHSAKNAADKMLPATEMMQKALEYWLRDTVQQHGYDGVCVPLDHPNSPLLVAAAFTALGTEAVCGLSFEGRECAHITTHQLQADKLVQSATSLLGKNTNTNELEARLRGSLLSSFAEDRGKMLLCPLDRNGILSGRFTPYGENCGALAPLGNLYRMDIYLLGRLYGDRYPELFEELEEPRNPEEDRIIHELMDRNIGAGDLLHAYTGLFREEDVRRLQRRITASAMKRQQLPLILQVSEDEEMHRFPLVHRLND